MKIKVLYLLDLYVDKNVKTVAFVLNLVAVSWLDIVRMMTHTWKSEEYTYLLLIMMLKCRMLEYSNTFGLKEHLEHQKVA